MVNVRVPWYEPALSDLEVIFTVTFAFAFGSRWPLLGVALSQFAPSAVVSLAFQSSGWPPLFCRVIVCVAAFCPVLALTFIAGGDASKLPGAATLRTTVTCGLAPPLQLSVP